MNLFYCCNDKIAEGIFLSATSVARRTKSAVNIYILTMDLTDKKPTYIPFSQENALTLRKALNTFNPENTATAVDLTEKFANAFPGGKNLKNSYTPYALLRLLTDDEKIKMCELVTKAGADFIKTSTGFSKAGATFADIELFAKHVGKNVRMKAAGGISSIEDAEKFVELGASRLGTSRIVKIVKKQESEGEY